MDVINENLRGVRLNSMHLDVISVMEARLMKIIYCVMEAGSMKIMYFVNGSWIDENNVGLIL